MPKSSLLIGIPCSFTAIAAAKTCHAAFLTIVCLANISFGQVFQAGDRVVVVENTEKKVETKSVGKLSKGEILTITQVSKDWLWIDGASPGWIQDKVVISFASHLKSRNADASTAKKNRDFEHARNIYSEILRIDPANEEAALHLADIFYSEKKYDEAVVEFTKFAEKWPINKDIYFWRGDAYRMLQKLPEAIDDYTKAIELSPRNTDLYEARARAYILAGAHNQAIVDSTLASMIASNGEKRAAAIATRALAWKAMSKDQNAASDFLIASDVAEKFRLYYLARAADIYANSTDGKVRNGRRSIDLLLSATADATTIDPVARCIIASGYASLGEFETAIELQKQALTNAAKIDLAKFERFLARFESKQSLDETVINYEFK